MDTVIATQLLYDRLPASTQAQMATALARLGFAPESPGSMTFLREGLRLVIREAEVPVGAEAFFGATRALHGLPEARAALLQIIGQHNAHVSIELEADELPAAKLTARIRLALLRLEHAAATAMAQAAPPLALLWGPTRRLMMGSDYRALAGIPAPAALFTAAEPLRQQQRGTRVRLAGAELFLGQPLLLRGATGTPAATLEAAGHAYLAAVAEGRDEGFRHGGLRYRVTGTGEGEMRELIALPAAAQSGLDSAA